MNTTGCPATREDFKNAKADDALLDSNWRCRECGRTVIVHATGNVGTSRNVIKKTQTNTNTGNAARKIMMIL